MSKFNDYLKTTIFILIIIQIVPSIISNLKNQWDNSLESRNKIGYICINGSIDNASSYRKHLSQYFKDCPVSLNLTTNGLYFPIYPSLNKKDINYIAHSVKTCLEKSQ